MNEFSKIPVNKIVDNMRKWRPQMETALSSGGGIMSYDDVESSVMEGRKIFFENDSAFAVVELVDHPNYRVAHVFLSGGEFDGIAKLQNSFDGFFRMIGVKKMTILGRKGFKKRLPALGWTEPMVYFERSL
ncbi:MAG: hypothetical protein EHM33_00355 [Chloroflexi bacterium]|nr:MAG: hypothetical protein EHM33_00355 [Chloroflexota bacterium]